MSQADQGISADNLIDVPMKRKRGRPRKFPKLIYDENILNGNNISKRHMEGIPISPGSGVHGNQSHPVMEIQNVSDDALGQAVSGVIEAVFEAGYLLCVRLGNSGITLRGVVFKPGHYVPVSAENDVAPDVQMITRNTVPFDTGNQSNGNNPRSKDGEVPSHESSGSKLGLKFTPSHSSWDASKDKSISSIFAQLSPSGSSRGTVVPVVLQPAKFTYESSVAAEPFTIQTANIESSKDKDALVGAFTAIESAPTQTVGIESFPFEPQTGQQVLQDDVSVANSSHGQSLVLEEVVHDSEGKSMALPSTPFESLVTEVIKRIQAPSLPAEMQAGNDQPTGKLSSDKEFEDNSEVEANIMDGPLMIEPPLKAVQQPLDDSSVYTAKAVDDESRTGKMTELLQVLQENMMQTPEPWAEVQKLGLMLKSDEPGESKTEIEDEETGNQK